MFLFEENCRGDQRCSTAALLLLLLLLLLRPAIFLKRPCATPARPCTSEAFKGRVPAWSRTRTAFGASEQPRQRPRLQRAAGPRAGISFGHAFAAADSHTLLRMIYVMVM